MTVTTTTPPLPRVEAAPTQSLTSGRLAPWAVWSILGGSVAIMLVIFGLMAATTGEGLNIAGWAVSAGLLYLVLIFVISTIVESRRKAVDRLHHRGSSRRRS